MLYIAICDDQEDICNEIMNNIKEYDQTINVKKYFSGQALCEDMKEGMYFDLIFLDIEMAQMNGIEVGKYIREVLNNDVTQIVYISYTKIYLLELFEVRPLHFLPKPLECEMLIRCIEKCRNLMSRFNALFSYKQGKAIYKVPLRDILYFESMNRKIKMVQQLEEVIFYAKLKDVYDQVKDYCYVDIHKSFIVNYNHIVKFEYDQVTMSNGRVLPISQNNRKKIREMQIKYEKEV